MNFLKKFTARKEIRKAIEFFNNLESKYPYTSYAMIKEQIEKVIVKHPEDVESFIQDNDSLEKWAHTAIANLSGDCIESGNFHLHRGVLNPLGPGKDLLQLYEAAIDQLVILGVIDMQKAEIEKGAIKNNMANVG